MSGQSRDITPCTAFGQDTCNFQPPAIGTTLRMQDVSAWSNAETIGNADARVAGVVRATTIVAITTADSDDPDSPGENATGGQPKILQQAQE